MFPGQHLVYSSELIILWRTHLRTYPRVSIRLGSLVSLAHIGLSSSAVVVVAAAATAPRHRRHHLSYSSLIVCRSHFPLSVAAIAGHRHQHCPAHPLQYVVSSCRARLVLSSYLQTNEPHSHCSTNDSCSLCKSTPLLPSASYRKGHTEGRSQICGETLWYKRGGSYPVSNH
jgi:hypothetical protein